MALQIELVSLHIWSLWGVGLEGAPCANRSCGKEVPPSSSSSCMPHILPLPMAQTPMATGSRQTNGGHRMPTTCGSSLHVFPLTMAKKIVGMYDLSHIPLLTVSTSIPATHTLHFPPRPRHVASPRPEWVSLSEEEQILDKEEAPDTAVLITE